MKTKTTSNRNKHC